MKSRTVVDQTQPQPYPFPFYLVLDLECLEFAVHHPCWGVGTANVKLVLLRHHMTSGLVQNEQASLPATPNSLSTPRFFAVSASLPYRCRCCFVALLPAPRAHLPCTLGHCRERTAVASASQTRDAN